MAVQQGFPVKNSYDVMIHRPTPEEIKNVQYRQTLRVHTALKT